MVQPLPANAPAHRPDVARPQQFLRPANTGKHDEFRTLLKRSKDAPPELGVADPASLTSSAKYPQIERELSLSERDFGALAPDTEPRWGRSPDPAEWLASITAGGSLNDGAGKAADAPAPAATRATDPELSQLVEGWVRRVALGGDQRRAVARLDIGHGSYAGAELVIAAEAGHVSVQLTLLDGTESSGLSERLRSRLAARGYAAEVDVR